MIDGRLWPRVVMLVAVTVAGLGSAACSDEGPGSGSSPERPGPGSSPERAGSGTCERWVGTAGSDSGSGRAEDPWATIGHAATAVPDAGCTVWVEPGVYQGPVEIDRRFTVATTFRSSEPQRAVLEHDSTVLDLDGASKVVVEGFVLRHAGPGSSGYVAIVDRHGGDDVWAEDITLRNNIFHDSYDDDLLKIHNGVRRATVEGNVFYNQGDSEQHIDVNSVTDVTIQGNVFFNDFARSGRARGATKAYIVVKDSGEDTDGQLGSERIAIRGNVFMGWQGARETMIQVGNDGRPYYEARDVAIESNLFVGDSPLEMNAPLGVRGAERVSFVGNTVVGDLPARSFGYWINIKDSNPINRDIVLQNNIWADPTGTMDEFSTGDPSSVEGFLLEHNLYWNGGDEIPAGEVADARTDAYRVIADPQLEIDHSDVVHPYWTGETFLSGGSSIRDEFTRLVDRYGAIPRGSPVVGAADPTTAPCTDILGRVRDPAPDLGAFEAAPSPDRERGVESCAGDD